MTEDQRDAVGRLGALARAAGLREDACPMFEPDQMPPATGEAFETWRGRVEAWLKGWSEEDRRRAGDATEDPALSWRLESHTGRVAGS